MKHYESVKVVVKSYPCDMEFITTKFLPKFNKRYSCKKRTKILFSELVKQEIDSPYHGYNDYIVEDVELNNGIETWIIAT